MPQPKIATMERHKAKTIRVCATCPFLKQNHDKPHPDKWYSTANIRRLWNGLRTGNAPGMICHSSDPKNTEYGGDKKVKPGKEQECAGALLLQLRHANEFNQICETEKKPWPVFRARHLLTFTLGGMRVFIERYLSGHIPPVEDNPDVSLPWEKTGT